MHPLPTVATFESKCDGSFRIDIIRIVIKNKEPSARNLFSGLQYQILHYRRRKSEKKSEKPESIDRSILNRQEKNVGESFRERTVAHKQDRFPA